MSVFSVENILLVEQKKSCNLLRREVWINRKGGERTNLELSSFVANHIIIQWVVNNRNEVREGGRWIWNKCKISVFM